MSKEYFKNKMIYGHLFFCYCFLKKIELSLEIVKQIDDIFSLKIAIK